MIVFDPRLVRPGAILPSKGTDERRPVRPVAAIASVVRAPAPAPKRRDEMTATEAAMARAPSWLRAAIELRERTATSDPHMMLAKLESERLHSGFAHRHQEPDCMFCRRATAKYHRSGRA